MAPVRKAMNQRRTGTAVLRFPHDIGTHGMLINFRKYQYQPTRGLLNSTSFVADSILLPLPKTLVDRTGVRVNRVELGTFGELVATGFAARGGGIGAMQDAVKALLPSGTSAANAVASLLGNAGGASEVELAAQANFLARSAINAIDRGVGAGIDVGTGTAINPKAALAFEGVDLKTHNFEWDFAPSDERESETLSKIIMMIKRNMLPTYENFTAGGETGLQRVFLRYPSLAEIFLIGLNEQHFFTYKAGMIQSLDINYSQAGQITVLKGGKPAIVGMNMSFYEADIHTAADYGAGENPEFVIPVTGQQ